MHLPRVVVAVVVVFALATAAVLSVQSDPSHHVTHSAQVAEQALSSPPSSQITDTPTPGKIWRVPAGMSAHDAIVKMGLSIPWQAMCGAGIGFLGFGLISAAVDWPEGALLLFLWIVPTFGGLFTTAYQCGKDLAQHKYDYRNFCTAGNGTRYFLGIIDGRAYYRYECGGYTGWGYEQGPTSSWPDKYTVAKKWEEDQQGCLPPASSCT